ncbi:DegV family protein [Halanaerobium salsuginis]|jgi:DegV family protein with EDD domain|uniref:EDD domain protein, DegV family n=1 Tax=Halanaerobium salsuginis TaxID=29563 RepID=A0A1I4EK77_9FIRM|nr:DegV family protein [Halanaerobium salsuginis]SFL05679.1 EDD domain protein, DegV family [Halanaerobium salsuginis]
MIALVTDSTCDLPTEILAKYEIEVVPLTVQVGEDSYFDKVDLTADRFIELMETSRQLPTTSQPAVGAFLQKYQELAAQYEQVISLHISAALSGTFESAKLAASQVSDLEISVIDSTSTSTGLGFLVVLAAKLIKQGKKLTEIEKEVIAARQNLQIYFTVNELTYLEKGGRIGKAQAFLGTIFNFNPILELAKESGKILPKDKVRGYKKTNLKLVELVKDAVSEQSRVNLACIYAKKSDNYQQFKELLTAELNNQEQLTYKLFENKIGNVLTSHTGPLVYGIVIYKGELLD